MNLEDTVREVLRVQVEGAPALDAPADRALAGARRLRRRRSLLAAGAAALVLVAGVGAGVLLERRGARTPPLPPATSGPSVAPSRSAPTVIKPGTGAALVNRLELIMSNGRAVDLTGVPGGANGAQQVPAGYLIDGYGAPVAGSASLWFATPDGSLRELLSGLMTAPAVSADGHRLAWRAGNQLTVGHLTGAGALVVDGSSTIATEYGQPIAVSDTAVVLGYTMTGGGIDRYDVWVPARGGYVPTWDATTGIAAMFGTAPDGRSFLGLIDAPDAATTKATCLAWLDPADHLRATKTACGLGTAPYPASAMSPDHRWLAVSAVSASGGGNQLAVVDLTSVWDRPVAAYRWDIDAPNTTGVWLDARTMVVLTQANQLRTYRLGQADPISTAPGPSPMPNPEMDTTYQLVPSLS